MNYDSHYKDLFSNPILVMELLKSFVDEDFISDLDFKTLKKLNTSFVTRKYRSREADVIYQLYFKNEPVYIYILLEFQSTVDKVMSLRMLEYVVEFYQDIYKTLKPKYFPPVFPILLYNGDKKWNASERFRDLIAPTSIPVEYLPDFRYYKIAINEIPKERLLKIKNAVSAIFFVENSNPESLSQSFKDLVQLVRSEQPSIIKLFNDWLFNLPEVPFSSKQISTLENLTEVPAMWATAAKEYKKKILQQGIQEGKQQGIQEGMQEGIELSRIATAQNAHKMGLSIENIVKLTGFSEEKVKEIIENLSK